MRVESREFADSVRVLLLTRFRWRIDADDDDDDVGPVSPSTRRRGAGKGSSPESRGSEARVAGPVSEQSKPHLCHSATTLTCVTLFFVIQFYFIFFYLAFRFSLALSVWHFRVVCRAGDGNKANYFMFLLLLCECFCFFFLAHTSPTCPWLVS